MPASFAYWKLRGLGQSVRLLMEYVGIDYTEKRYEFGPAPDFDQSQWLTEKFKLGMDFPNLPYYFDAEGQNKITQSHAILKYIARKHGLMGKCEQGEVRVDMAEHEALDMRQAWAKLVYSSKDSFENTKDSYSSGTLKTKLEKFSKFLGKHDWFAGEYLTYVDFLLYELFDIHRTLYPCCLNDCDNLQKFMLRFESLEPIRKYMHSCRFMKTPVNGPMAAFVGN